MPRVYAEIASPEPALSEAEGGARNDNVESLRGAQATKQSLSIPREFGSIDSIFQGQTGTPQIYYIQDAHNSLEAQENISKLVSYLVKEKSIKTVFVEGYEGEMPLGSLFPIQDKWKKERVAYFLMDYLRLGGAEYAFLNRDQDFKIIGIEKLSDYKADLESYKNSSKNREIIAKDLAEISKHLNVLAGKLYPKEIQEYQKLKERFETKKLSLADYVFRLMKTYGSKEEASLKATYPHLSLISANLSKRELTKQEQEELDAKLKEIDSKVFFKELNQFEKDFINKFLLNPNSRETFNYQRTLELLTKLNSLTLMPEEYEELLRNPALKVRGDRGGMTEAIAQFLSKSLKKSILLSNEWEGLIPEALKFYEIARKRDEDFEMSLRGAQATKQSQPVIVITGGFHQYGITQFLEENKVSYALISPRITKEDPKHQSRYDFLMSGNYYPFESQFISSSHRPQATSYLANAVKPEGIANLALDGFSVSEETLALASSLGKGGDVDLNKFTPAMTAAVTTMEVLKGGERLSLKEIISSIPNEKKEYFREALYAAYVVRSSITQFFDRRRPDLAGQIALKALEQKVEGSTPQDVRDWIAQSFDRGWFDQASKLIMAYIWSFANTESNTLGSLSYLTQHL